MVDIQNLTPDKSLGYIREIHHTDINILMSDLIDEDRSSAIANGYRNHLEMIAKTVMHSESAYSIIDPEERFCSAFGFIPITRKDSALVWLLSCNNYFLNKNKINVSKRLLDLSNSVLDQVNKKYSHIICNVEKGNSFAARRTKLMGFKKSRELDRVDEYIREA